MRIQMQGSLLEDGRRWYLGILGTGSLREFTLLEDTAPSVVAALLTACKKKETMDLDVTDIDQMRRPGA